MLVSPDGGRMAFTNTGAAGAGLYVMNADGTGVIRLVPGADGHFGVPFAWSADGTRVYYLADGAFVVAAEGGTPTPIPGVPSTVFSISLSPDERNIVVAEDTAQALGSPYFYDHTRVLKVVPTDGGPARTLVTADSNIPDPFGPSWSPDGHSIAFSGGACDVGPVIANLYMVDADGSNLTTLIANSPGTACEGAPVWSPDGSRLAVPIHDPSGGPPAGRNRIAILDPVTHRLTGGFSTTWYAFDPHWALDGSALMSKVFDGNDALHLYLSVPAGAPPVLLGGAVLAMAFVR